MTHWRKLTPVYDPHLSGNRLLAQGELFDIGDSPLPVNDTRAPHWHDTYELGYVRSGRGVIVMGQNEYPFEPGQVYIINDLKPHMGYTTEHGSMLFVVHFHPTILDDGWVGQMGKKAHAPFLHRYNPASPLIPLDNPITVPVRSLLESIYLETQNRAPAWEIVIGGLILQAVGLLARWLLKDTSTISDDQPSRDALKRIGPALRLIEARYAEPLTLAEMASAAHMSRAHCCALFRCALNITPIAYRNARRIAESRQLLKHTDLPVGEIAHKVGFTSAQEFNRLFRRECDVTPRKFRARMGKSEF